MLYEATTKVPGGKLLRVKVEAEDFINAVRISGDFFLHPEEALPAVEKSLIGQTVPPSDESGAPHEAQLSMLIHSALAREKAAFLGVSPEDVARTVVKALQQPVG
jgi:lipoate-protein ligase A